MLVLIAHAQKPLIKAHVGEARISMQNCNSTVTQAKTRVDPNQLITNAKIC